MLSKVITAVTKGTEGKKVIIETDISNGMPGLTIVGLADTTVKEARERIRAALLHMEKNYPLKRITVNLSPANIRKKGSHFDLPMALGILISSGQLAMKAVEDYGFIGELSLDGRLNRCRGILPMVMALRKEGIRKVVVPYDNREEAVLVKGMEIYGAESISQVYDHFHGGRKMCQVKEKTQIKTGEETIFDFREVKGQQMAKRAVTIAVAGGHGLFMMGSPAAGKTMIAERIPGIMPDLSYDEMVQLTQLYSVAGLLDEETPYISKRPFRKPFHRITPAGFLGGGTNPVPGEISLAHKGVLFLDELGEFDRRVIEGLRIPLEKKTVSVMRKGENYIFPADFLLVAASNPCRCGYYGDPSGKCHCTLNEVRRYQSKISGPVLDRIDLQIHLQPVNYDTLSEEEGESSAEMKRKIEQAREVQKERYSRCSFSTNGSLDDHSLDYYCRTDREGSMLLKEAYERLNLNPRTAGKVRRTARTIADLEGSEQIRAEHIGEALQYREQVKE